MALIHCSYYLVYVNVGATSPYVDGDLLRFQSKQLFSCTQTHDTLNASHQLHVLVHRLQTLNKPRLDFSFIFETVNYLYQHPSLKKRGVWHVLRMRDI